MTTGSKYAGGVRFWHHDALWEVYISYEDGVNDYMMQCIDDCPARGRQKLVEHDELIGPEWTLA